MQEGDTELGGLQIPHGQNVNPPTPTPGPQPVASAVPQNPQPTPPTPSATQPTAQTFTPNSITNRETQLNSLASQSTLISQQVTPPQSFQQFSTQSVSITSDGGDVVFGDTSPKKSKKRAITGIAIAVLIFVGIVVGTIFVLGKNEKQSEYSNESASKVFNRFVNYYIKGDNSTENFGQLSIDGIYALDKNLYAENNSNRSDYFRELYDLWNVFQSKYIVTNSDEDLIKSINNYLSLLYLYVDKGVIPDETLVAKYSEGGDELYREYYEEYYVSDIEDTDAVKMFMFLQSEHMNDLSHVLDSASEAGCISNNTLDSSCLVENGISNTYEYEKCSDFMVEIMQYIGQCKMKMKDAVTELSNIFRSLE